MIFMPVPILINSRATTGGGLEFFDGTQTLFIIPLDGGTFQFGSSGNGMDIRIWGDTTNASMLWDEGGDRLIFNDADLHLGNNDNISFGDSQDVVMAWTSGTGGEMFDILPAAANTQMNVGSTGYPLNVKHEGNVSYRRPRTFLLSTGTCETLSAASNRIQFLTSNTNGRRNVALPAATTDNSEGLIFYLTNNNTTGGFMVWNGATDGAHLAEILVDETGIFVCNGAVWGSLVAGPST